MRPTRIEMAGFGAFRAPTDLDLTDVDLFALVGPTGAGKSTVIDAITFALYGAVARYGHNNMVAPAINQRSSEARLRLTFELGGTEYVAARVVRRTKGGGATTREVRLEHGDEVLTDNHREMGDKVTELIGLDVDQFNRTVVLPQGQFAEFLRASVGDRQATLRRLLGFDLYTAVGREARKRAEHAEVQAQTLRDEVSDDAARLTDEHRAELVATRDALRDGRDTARGLVEGIDTAERRRRELDTRIEHVERDRKLLGDVVVPDGLDELDRELERCRAGQRRTSEAVDAARQRRGTARQALADGPDAVRLQRILDAYEQQRQLSGEADELTARVAATEAELGDAQAAVQRDADHQRELDEAETAARELLDRATADRDATMHPSTLDRVAEQHREAAGRRERLANLDAEREPATAIVEQLRATAADATERRRAAVAALDNARARHGVAGHRHLLVSGEPCPLCEQQVGEPPPPSDDALVTTAEAGLAEADEQLAVAARELDGSEQSLRALEAQRTQVTERLGELDAALEGRPDLAAIEQQRADYAELQERVTAAAAAHRATDTAARQFRASAERAERAEVAAALAQRQSADTARQAAIDERLAAAAVVLADAPDADTTREQHRAAQQLAGDVAEADRALDDAEQAAGLAADELRRLDQQLAAGARHLQSVRERVAALDVPADPDDTLTGRWRVIAEWAADTDRAREQELAALGDKRDRAAGTLSELHQQLHSTASVLPADEPVADTGDDDTPSAVLDRFGDALAAAEAELRRFDADVERLAETRTKVDGYTETAAVAGQLGQILKADRFEKWLMRSAVHQLVERATERLFELSGGRYSLVLADDDTFAVRDHTNADELRSAITLSGGETFLASLSLALALSASTADLAPEGAPRIESIFLDEGFGTLDADTLDVVASAIEELGAAGRMVGIITHIRELADRMPVRLEVSNAGGDASVERVDQ